jgi:hypothetical protein
MSRLPEKLEKLRTEHKLNRDDFWQAHGNTWCIKHKALETIAQAIGIKWEQPQILEQDSASAVSMIVTGRLGDVAEWSVGEASPKNNKNAYPWAMAEKRAKDRVILKLVGVAGDVYSEEEADDFKAAKPKAKPTPRGEVGALDQGERTNREVKDDYNRLLTPLQQCSTLDDLRDWKDMFSDDLAEMPEDHKDSLRGEFARRRQEFMAKAA